LEKVGNERIIAYRGSAWRDRQYQRRAPL